MDVACQKTDEHDKRRAEDNDVTREKKSEIEFVIGGRSWFLWVTKIIVLLCMNAPGEHY